jgi:NAD(P)-dependent dehydrogenase (short-subunit alcohol dehydrogenase family)
MNHESAAMTPEWVGSGIDGSVVDRLSLNGRTAVVTGGLRGIGRALAIGLAEAGAEIAVLDRDAGRDAGRGREDVIEQVRAMGRTHSFAVFADVTKRQSLEAGFDEAVKRWGKVDIALANAGIGIDVNAEDMTEEQWDRLMSINLKGVFLTAQVAAAKMIPNRRGIIIVTSSQAGSHVGGVPHAAYNTSKAAANMLVRCLAYEWARYNIRVNAIAPGFVMTDLLKPYLSQSPDDAFSLMVKPSPMGRIASPDELAGAAVFLASDASSYMTGQVMVINGGYDLTPLEYRLMKER